MNAINKIKLKSIEDFMVGDLLSWLPQTNEVRKADPKNYRDTIIGVSLRTVKKGKILLFDPSLKNTKDIASSITEKKLVKILREKGFVVHQN